MPKAKNQPTILAVDDDKRNRELLDVVLTHHGYRILTSASGTDALEVLASERIDLAIVDVAMPGMDGNEFVARIRADEKHGHIPVILVSAQRTEDADVIAGLKGGADDFVVKPFDQAVLLARVEGLLRAKEYHDELRKAYSELQERSREIERLNEELNKRNRDLSAFNAHIRRELRMARDVQLSLLPERFPACPRLRFTVVYEPSEEVGGDYYDFVELVDNSLGVLVADVAGHGLPAAFIAAVTKMAFDNSALTCARPSLLAEKMNARLLPTVKGGKYITCFYGIFSPERDRFAFVRAGHPRPMLIRGDGRIEELDSRGRPLGILAEGDYTEESVALAPGDKIIIFTDGVFDCVNVAHERFGTERVEEIVRGSIGESAATIVGNIQSELERFTAGVDFRDDVTILGIDVLEAPSETED